MCSFVSPALVFPAPSAAASAWPWRTARRSGHRGHGGRIRRLRSGVRRAFPTLSRLGACSGKRGAASAQKCQCGLEIEARLPGSASSSSFIHDEARNRSHRALLNFLSLFLCRRQRVWESLLQFRILKKKDKGTVATCEFSLF